MKIELNKPFAGNSPADAGDVRVVKRALNLLGYYVPFEKVGMTTVPDAEVFTALRDFQTDQGLPDTGAAKPDDEVIKILNKKVSKKLRGE